MKGIVLAGGMGTRLGHLTKVINKHLLPVYDKPMIYYPLETLKQAGITEIMIVLGGNSVGNFIELLRDGTSLGVQLTYRLQDKPDGIGGALRLCEGFVGNDNCMIILGDNIIEDDLSAEVANFTGGAKVLLKEVHDPQRFGVAEIVGENIVSIEEKPTNPKSNLAVIGIYLYDSNVFEHIRHSTPSDRGELEITDVNNRYIANNQLTYGIVKGFWLDAGKPSSLFEANRLMAHKGGIIDPPSPDGDKAK